MGLGDTRSKRFVFSVLNKSQFRAGGATWDSLWKIFAWSVNTLLHCENPTKDVYEHDTGESGLLADGFSDVLVQMRRGLGLFFRGVTFP